MSGQMRSVQSVIPCLPEREGKRRKGRLGQATVLEINAAALSVLMKKQTKSVATHKSDK